VTRKNMPECKRENSREMVDVTRKNNLRNHRLRLFLAKGEIALDNPWACTYYTLACAKCLTSNVREIHVGNRVSRGADSRDE
jgi:hypothetical protein